MKEDFDWNVMHFLQFVLVLKDGNIFWTFFFFYFSFVFLVITFRGIYWLPYPKSMIVQQCYIPYSAYPFITW